jgi:hypothetical protein
MADLFDAKASTDRRGGGISETGIRGTIRACDTSPTLRGRGTAGDLTWRASLEWGISPGGHCIQTSTV